MKRTLKWIYWAAGAACIGYYFVIGHASRFGLSMSWMWPAAGCILLLAGVGCCLPVPDGLRRAWRAVVCVGLAIVLALGGCVVSGMRQTPPDGLEYLIVLGARVEEDGPSPALRRRLNATLEYLVNNPETVVIASGGQGPDEPMSEAECIRTELIEAGVPAERILTEDRSTTTAENLAFSLELMESPDASAGVVTNNYHVFRAVRLAENAGLTDVHGLAAKYTGYTLFHYMIREVVCLIADGLRGNL